MKNKKSRKIIPGICLILVLVILIWCALVTFTQFTLGWAEHTAQKEFDKSFGDFGELTNTSYYVSSYTLRSLDFVLDYGITFNGKSGDVAEIRVSPYLPFIVLDKRIIQAGTYAVNDAA